MKDKLVEASPPEEAASVTENSAGSRPEPPPLDQVEPGAEPNPPAIDPSSRSFVVIHSNPDGAVFASRLSSTSKGNAIEALNEARPEHLVLTVQEDIGQTGLTYEGGALTVANLSDEG